MPAFVFLLLFFLLVSCGSDAADTTIEATDDALLGRWELVEARRNNVRTETLGVPGQPDNLYLTFGPGDRFETNLLTPGSSQVGSFARDETELEVAAVELPLTYELVALEGNVLTLRSRIEGYLFEFLLQRADPPPPAG